ncbi:juvenile hormone esterase-like isoform X2 [Chironomus tepperi]|uniref:juvenile hormone esterase-like isoform X2 n=1 Tax=Chironomus tepperi TaxID=113505 RepID=UPI00391F0BA4
MKLLKTLILILFVNFCASYEEKDDMIVEINDGKILGRHIVSNSGKSIRAFIGIPYAEKPLGELRFKPAQKVKKWEGVLPTQDRPPLCMQFNPFIRSWLIQGEEDCLYVNVYTPEKSDKKLPVLLYIHGGGWIRGDAYPYSPEYLLDHDIIYVAANYRVGTLGYLSTEDENCPGNYGFKDQSFVLKWVQENIEFFGGDKNSVTIWGESAGGASVNYHMFSPMSKNLFHRAISHSGTLNTCWSDPGKKGDARKKAFFIGKQVNCIPSNENDTKELIECLRKVDAEKLIEASTKMYTWDNDPVVLFNPVIEDFESDEEPFIAERSFVKDSTDIPWLIGMNSEEGLLKVGAIIDSKEFTDELISGWDTILPDSFLYNYLNESEQTEITRKINDFYFGNITVSDKMRDPKGLIDLWTDGWFIGMFESLKNRFEQGGNDNTYVFYFTHKSTASFSQSKDFHGTCHVDDLIPLFSLRKSYYYSSVPTQHDKDLTRVMTAMWVNFARTGKPNPDNLPSLPQWPAASGTSMKYLQIGNENGNSQSLFQLKENFLTERADFWMNLREDHKLNSWQKD